MWHSDPCDPISLQLMSSSKSFYFFKNSLVGWIGWWATSSKSVIVKEKKKDQRKIKGGWGGCQDKEKHKTWVFWFIDIRYIRAYQYDARCSSHWINSKMHCSLKNYKKKEIITIQNIQEVSIQGLVNTSAKPVFPFLFYSLNRQPHTSLTF